jgi:hypothetical protein
VKALFFSPFSNIWEHSFPESLIAEGLVEQGVEVLAVRCGGMLDAHCVAMSAAGVGARDSLAIKQQVCRACVKRRDLIDRTMPFPSVVMDEFITADDRSEAEAACASTTPESWPGIMVDGVPLGRYAAYEFLLNHKLVGTTIPAELWPLYLDQLGNAIIVFRVAQRMIAEHKPTRVVVFNRLYSVNHAFCAAADQAGVPTYTLQGGGHITRRAETMTMYKGSQSLAEVFRTEAWNTYKSQPIGEAEVSLVGEHFSGLLEGSSAFAYSSAFEASQPETLRAQFGVASDRTVLLVPLSSEDEINAARLADALPFSSGQTSIFEGQFEWIAFLLAYAAQRSDLHFIIRLHPRMFPNKRDNVQSPVVEQLMTLLENAPANVSLNLPSDQISLYDVMQIVDVLLSYRSSVGAELAAFGIPVVVPANADFFTYPEEINLIGISLDDYTAKIDQAITAGWSIENTRRSFRWFAFLFSRVAVDFSESVHARPIAIRPKKPGFRLWVWRKLVYIFIQFGPLIRERIALRNRQFPVTSQQLFLDVLANERGSLAESRLWSEIDSSVPRETDLLTEFLDGLSTTLWKDISTPTSLAGKVRRHLQPTN